LTGVFDAATNLFVGPDEVAMAWMRDGLCRGESDLFFAPFAERPEARVRREAEARDLCSRCPSGDPCRQYARDNRELGFWGAESEAERATAGFAPTTPIIGRRQVAAERAAAALAAAAGGS
jgi:WhiB family redox-sensing transcriptional regulator